MSNYNNSLGLIHFQIHTNYDGDTKEALLKIFSHDLDFIENEDFFRKDTLKLGYRHEAERLVSEYIIKHRRLDNLKKITTAVEKLAKKVFDNPNYYERYEVSVDEVDDHIFSVAIAYYY
jgi:hypothetical protein